MLPVNVPNVNLQRLSAVDSLHSLGDEPTRPQASLSLPIVTEALGHDRRNDPGA